MVNISSEKSVQSYTARCSRYKNKYTNLICGKTAVGRNYNLPRDNMKAIECLVCFSEKPEAVGFIRTFKSDEEAYIIGKQLQRVAGKNGFSLKKVMVDHSAGKEIDREAVKALFDYVDRTECKHIFVRSVREICSNQDNLYTFLKRLYDAGASVYSINDGINPRIDYEY